MVPLENGPADTAKGPPHQPEKKEADEEGSQYTVTLSDFFKFKKADAPNTILNLSDDAKAIQKVVSPLPGATDAGATDAAAATGKAPPPPPPRTTTLEAEVDSQYISTFESELSAFLKRWSATFYNKKVKDNVAITFYESGFKARHEVRAIKVLS